MKKILVILLAIICILPITGCTNDARKFKKEYEKLNGTTSSSGKEIRSINIDSDNPFVYKTASDIVTMIKNEESFIVYFGFASCPWCRSMVTNLIKAAKDTNTKTIYYVDVLEIRDTLALDDVGNVYREKDGDSYYMQLISIMEDVLEDYTLTKDGKTIKTGEKRIYAPNVIAIKKGVAYDITTGISNKQNDGYAELTDTINEESYDMLKDLLSTFNGTCDEKAC
ncbi:MAG: hypothetical protein IJ565_05130 [Bacilli bacterium]|nr:hypothetical protein [Bacilli bacterium]